MTGADSADTSHRPRDVGECFAYALAHSLGAPLLYKGNDFGRTDGAPA